MPGHWDGALETIELQTHTVLAENDGLKSENRRLEEETRQLRQAIAEQQSKNAGLEHFLKVRHGRTDQQMRMDDLTGMIKTKSRLLAGCETQMRSLQKNQYKVDRNIERIKQAISRIETQGLPAAHRAPSGADEVALIRRQVDEENKQERLLNGQLDALQAQQKAQISQTAAVDRQNQQLQARLEALQAQVPQIEKQAKDKQTWYGQLKSQKEELEARISVYESRMEQLRRASLAATMTWSQRKKRMVHEMVQVDTRNNKIRANIKVVREDIDVLRDKVAQLERRMDFAGAQAKQQ